MRLYFTSLAVFMLFGIIIFMIPNEAEARTKCPGSMRNDVKHCGLWLCIPGGMPESCRPKWSNILKQRVAKNCPPLPRYNACADGDGAFKTGHEEFFPCKSGYRLVEDYDDDDNVNRGSCINTDNSCERRSGVDDDRDRSKCGDHAAQRRVKQNWVDVQVGRTQYPRFWY